MLSLYRPGNSWWHRLPAGRKTLIILALALLLSFLPVAWWSAAVAAGTAVLSYALPGVGMRLLVRHLRTVSLILVFTLISQLLFVGVQAAIVNSVRVASVVVIASLLSATTPMSALLDTFERALAPLARLRIDTARIALLFAVSLGTLPVLARAARDVREAQLARGGRMSLRLFAVPFLIVALKHADELGEALTARGVQ